MVIVTERTMEEANDAPIGWLLEPTIGFLLEPWVWFLFNWWLSTKRTNDSPTVSTTWTEE